MSMNESINVSTRLIVFLLLSSCLWACLFPTGAWAQDGTQFCISVRSAETGAQIDSVWIQTPDNPPVTLSNSDTCLQVKDKFIFRIGATGYETLDLIFTIQHPGSIYTVILRRWETVLDEIRVEDSAMKSSRGHLREVEGMALYAAKKTEVLHVPQLAANLSVNLSRQLYAQIPGLNVWDSDGGGLQMSFGARGLDPNRLSSFNVRQNGYDISADALGYPESYYTPPAEALERIEVVRGAAALQYGPQFGGLVNYVFKRGTKGMQVDGSLKQTVGSFGLFATSASVGGEIGKRTRYYQYLQYRQSDGWRPNDDLRATVGFTGIEHSFDDKWSAAFEFTHLHYRAHQPGGLTDVQFERDPSVSLRARNWFRVQWLLPSARLTYEPSKRSRFELRAFGLLASRDALGNLERIHVVDLPGNRMLIADQYRNIGAETRYLQHFDFLSRWPSAFLAGIRAYRGQTLQQQGQANAGSSPDFEFLQARSPDQASYRNPGYNLSAFAETALHLNEHWTLAPGVRFEGIETRADGYYQTIVRDVAGNEVARNRQNETQARSRAIILAGLGLSYRNKKHLEAFANYTRNYRPITYSDLRIQNPSLKIDPQLQDERGWNADLGLRGASGKTLRYDASLFVLAYANRIGEVLRADEAPLYLPYRFRTNVGRSLSRGIESYVEWEPTAKRRVKQPLRLMMFVNAAYMQAEYTESDEPSVSGKQIEYAPAAVVRTGVSLEWRGLRLGLQQHYTSKQYADASNADFSSNASIGRIPAYHVGDLSLKYSRKHWAIDGGCNNLWDARYFTRRAVAYPGPGILPSPPRSFYVGIEIYFQRPKPANTPAKGEN